MNLLGFSEKLAKAIEDGAVTDDGSVVIMVRNPDVPVDHDDAFDILPARTIERDETDIELLAGERDTPALTIGDLRAWVRREMKESAECHIYVPAVWDTPTGETAKVRTEYPAIATVFHPALNMFGVMAFFEDYESYLHK